MPKKKRVKVDASILLSIPSWDHADQYVRHVGELKTKIAAAEQNATKQMEGIKAALAKTVKPLQEEIYLVSKSLGDFCEAHKGEFVKARSKKLNHGTVGWRKSTFITVTKKTLGLIKDVFGRKAAAYIHVKETPDKEALAKLTDEELAGVSARRRVTDDFFVEPDLTEAANYANQR